MPNTAPPPRARKSAQALARNIRPTGSNKEVHPRDAPLFGKGFIPAVKGWYGSRRAGIIRHSVVLPPLWARVAICVVGALVIMRNSSGRTHPEAPAKAGPERARMRENFLFLGKFFKHGVTIASFWPSSPALSKATIKQIDWAKAKVIVELGAGTGPITEQIIRRLQPHTTFIAIERDADFAKILQRRFAGHENVHIVQGDVRDLDGIMRKFNVDGVDAFVSGLPTPSLPKPVRRRMLAAVRRYLVDGGVFSNITEVPFWYWRYYKNVFEKVRFDLVVANMPPGGVYHCWACK